MSKPSPLLTARLRDDNVEPALLAVCAGYENGEWRCQQLARHVILDWIVDFVLPFERHGEVDAATAGRQFRDACEVIYNTEKYQRRGEFGEILLHAILRQEYDTSAAISKIFLKSSVNDTVKGFDAVHVVATSDGLELWLGEVKFYAEINRAISDVVRELHDHLASAYIRREFILITNKLGKDAPYAEELRRLIAPNASLDDIFARIRVPVLLTYDSNVLGGHKAVTEEFLKDFSIEMRKVHAAFVEAIPPKIALYLILLPLNTKDALVSALHTKLKTVQDI